MGFCEACFSTLNLFEDEDEDEAHLQLQELSPPDGLHDIPDMAAAPFPTFGADSTSSPIYEHSVLDSRGSVFDSMD